MMLMTTVGYMEGKKSETLGMVRGVTVFSKNMVKDIGASLKSVVGGELKSYTDLLETAVNAATDKMQKEAEALMADAIIGVRYSTCDLLDGGAEMIVYGTAVKFI